MENITKVTIRGNRKIISELAFSSSWIYQPINADTRLYIADNIEGGYLSPVAVEVCEPQHLGRLPKDQVESLYMTGKRYNQYMSDVRKEEIWQQIVSNRKELQNIAMTIQHKDVDTVVRPLPLRAREAITTMDRVSKLWDKIVNYTSTPYSQVKQMQLV